VGLNLRVLTVRGSRLQGTKGDGRLKTTTSWVGHRLHAWEENRKRRGVARIRIWATPLGWQHYVTAKATVPGDLRTGPGSGVPKCFLCALPTRHMRHPVSVTNKLLSIWVSLTS
jgi:hypothetical protein